MPSFIIHIAIAKEYIRKNEIINKERFIKGSIAPDLVKNKSKSHYGNWGIHQADTFIDRFLNDENVDMNDDYFRGYFLHLYADNLFYKQDFKEEYEAIIRDNGFFYEDYDIINKELKKKYDIYEFPEEIEEYIQEKEGIPKYLTDINKLFRFIEKVSSINIEKEAEKILNENKELKR